MYVVLKVSIREISEKQPFAKVYTRKFYEIGRSRKFVPAKLLKRVIRESLYPRNLISVLGVRESLYPRKLVPAKVSTIKVVVNSVN